jgi:hypothetical protein
MKKFQYPCNPMIHDWLTVPGSNRMPISYTCKPQEAFPLNAQVLLHTPALLPSGHYSVYSTATSQLLEVDVVK